jgi:hypothetical protein
MKRCFFVVLVLGVVLVLAWWMRRSESVVTEVVRMDTVVVVRTDTVRMPEPVEVVKMKEVVRTLPVYCEAPLDSTRTAEVVLPIEQKVYRDSSYTAYVSGYEAQLDSIILNTRTEVVRITEREEQKRWSVGVGVGAGIGKDGVVGPMLGITINYRLFSF